MYDFLKRINAASLRRNWRVDGDGLERLEQFQRGILAFNHGHLVDGTVVMPLVHERVLFMCDARAVDAPILGHVLRAMGVLRVDVTRPDPLAAVAAVRAASAGHLLGVFPEGRVSGARGLLPARLGVAYVAARWELPILPVAIWGLEAFDRPLDVYVRRVRPVINVRVGAPHVVRALVRDREAVRVAADAIMVLIAGMLPVPMRGVYQDRSDHYERGCHAINAGWVRPLDAAPSWEAPPSCRGKILPSV
ncbi:MAG: lysophospholipid acyltransferase family protein [Dehalococcoidia bacterium]